MSWPSKYLVLLLSVLLIQSCASFSSADDANRTVLNSESDDLAKDERETVQIVALEGSVGKFKLEPANIESVNVVDRRLAVVGEQSGTEKHVVVRGYFPDGCSVLHELEKSDSEEYDFQLVVRRPKGQMCIQAVRPFLFQFSIGEVPEGSHKLSINKKVVTFEQDSV